MSWITPTFLSGSPMGRIIPVRKTFATESLGFREGPLAKTHAALASGQRMLVEYKPFEPAFYHTDIADWGMALLFARAAGPQAFVLVDTGHHYQAQNIEQIPLSMAAREKNARRFPLQRSPLRR